MSQTKTLKNCIKRTKYYQINEGYREMRYYLIIKTVYYLQYPSLS